MKSSFKSNVFCFKGTQGRAGAERERGRGTRKRGNTKRGGIFKGERIFFLQIYSYLQIDIQYDNLKEHKWRKPYAQYLSARGVCYVDG